MGNQPQKPAGTLLPGVIERLAGRAFFDDEAVVRQQLQADQGTRHLPLNLLDALRAFDASAMLRQALGSLFVDSYVKLPMAEWHDYMRHLTEWERVRTLEV